MDGLYQLAYYWYKPGIGVGSTLLAFDGTPPSQHFGDWDGDGITDVFKSAHHCNLFFPLIVR